MNKEAMQQLIVDSLSKRLGEDFHISIHEVLKTNIKLDGLIILKKGDNISPTIYLDSFYKELDNGAFLDGVVDEILYAYFDARIDPSHFDTASIQNFDYVKDKLYVKLINRHFNKELLQNVPHLLFLDDFAIIIRCLLETSAKGNASFLIHNEHLNMWHMDQNALMSLAIKNTRKVLGLNLQNIKNVLQELSPNLVADDSPDIPMWVMTNNQKLAGAATILFDDILKDFADIYGDFYVIFSSVHEVLLIPASSNADISFLAEVNQMVNATDVQPDELLGTKAYLYSKERGFVL